MKILVFASLMGLPMAYLQFVEKYIFNDWEMAGAMVLLVVLDTATGLLVAWRAKGLSSNKLGRIPIKIICYGASLIIVHLLSHTLINGEPNLIMGFIMPYVDSVLYTGIMLKEVLSVNENTGKLGYPFLPVWITKRIQDFNEKGKYAPGYDTDTSAATPAPPAP